MQKVLGRFARGVVRVFKGWGKSLIELVKGIFWVIRHPLRTISRILMLVLGALRVVFKLHRMGNFLKESLYEPYKAMTTLAVSGAFVLVWASFLEDEQVIMVGTILLSASGIAYLLWRSVEFYHGNENTADGIDGFILVTELLPILGGLAVITRLARLQGMVTRVEGLAVRTESALAKTQGALVKGQGVSARGLSATGRVASRGGEISKTAKTIKGINSSKAVKTVVQPAMSVGEWLTHWIQVSDEFANRAFETIKNVGKRTK
ncbi:MAG: hypothetical protein J7L23_00815 [Candidatus Diapherotrites archaeon]|nr:hypothetical protein [Candidatus Diapherotrites archaeon]